MATTWITVNGQHIPIKEGQSAQDALGEKFGNTGKGHFIVNQYGARVFIKSKANTGDTKNEKEPSINPDTIKPVNGGYKTPEAKTYGEAKAIVRGVIDKDSKNSDSLYGLRFEDKARNIGDSVSGSRHNPDRADERDFPQYGSKDYKKLPPLGGASAWNIDPDGNDKKWEGALMGEHDTNSKKITQGGHAYIIRGNIDNTHSDADPNEIVIGDAKVIAKIY